MASTELKNTNNTIGNRKTGTMSFWVKRSKLGVTQYLYSEYYDGNNCGVVYFSSADTLNFISYSGGSVRHQLSTNRKFRDTSAWYHIHIMWDTTDATADDRQKIYINGVQETSFSARTNPTQDIATYFGLANSDGFPIRVGSIGLDYFDGSFAHFHRVDGQALAHTVFGSTDSTTGIWKPKTNPSITYTGSSGHNFFLKFENSGSMGTDSSGNGNNLTVNGTMTQTIDTPSNVFATLNPLNQTRFDNGGVYSNGNTKFTTTSDNALRGYGFTTFGVTQGKWYWEIKVPTTERAILGVGDAQFVSAQTVPFFDINPSYSVGLNCPNGALNYNGTSNSSYYGTAVNANDIIQFALDMDNHLFWYGINGTWLNSATQTEIENGTATNDVTTAIGTQNVINNGEPIFPFVCDVSGTGKSNFECNFGNGYFGTTAVASAQNPDDGIGIFEYSVPTGYKALCTKSINAQEYD